LLLYSVENGLVFSFPSPPEVDRREMSKYQKIILKICVIRVQKQNPFLKKTGKKS